MSRLELASALWRLQGPDAGFTAGAHSWAAALEPGEERLWQRGARTVAWLEQADGAASVLLHPEHEELAAEVLDGVGADALWLPAGQEALRREAERRGFTVDADGPWFAVHVLELRDLPPPAPPDGFRLRAVDLPREADERVRVHRAAWQPSRFGAETYARVRESPLYRPELDRVAEAPDGGLAASALAWLDPANAVGELEPVGTDPCHRGLGLAGAVCLDALHALAAAGAERVVVCPRGDDAYPLPRRLYASIGFRPAADVRRYVRG